MAVPDRWSEIEHGPQSPPRTLSGRRGVAVAVAFVLFAASAYLVWSAFRPTTSPAPQPATSPYTLPTGELVEPMTEQEQAEVFAFRALAATGLMNPYGDRSFGFTYRDDTTRTDTGWRVGFAAIDCGPTQTTDGPMFTCRGLSGEEQGNGNPLTDAYVTVELAGNVWIVTGFDGNVLDEERGRVVGYSLPQQAEPSHWEFPAIAVWRGPDGKLTGNDSFALWVGPYPTDARGSVCDLHAVGADGSDLGSLARWYEEPPNRPFERAGWMMSRGFDPPEGMEAASVACRQYTGEGWEVVGAPKLMLEGGRVVRIELEWHGDVGITTPVVCEAEVLDVSGAVVWRGQGRAESLWPPPEPDAYPYHAQVFVPRPADSPLGGDHVGSVGCRSL